MRRHFDPPSLAMPFGRYHQAVEVAGGGRLLFVSGQLAIRPDGGVPDGIEAQAETIFDAIEACLAAAGMEMRHLARLTTFLTDLADRSGYMAVRDRRVAEPPPASTLLAVAGLAHPAARIEIEATAVADG